MAKYFLFLLKSHCSCFILCSVNSAEAILLSFMCCSPGTLPHLYKKIGPAVLHFLLKAPEISILLEHPLEMNPNHPSIAHCSYEVGFSSGAELLGLISISPFYTSAFMRGL